MAITNYDLDIRAGGTNQFVVDVVGGPASLSGYVGWLEIRPIRGSQELLAQITAPDIVVNDITRQVTVTIPGEETAEYAFTHGVYDVLLVHPSADPWVLLQGHVRCYAPITVPEV